MAEVIQKIQFKRGTKENLETVLIGDNKLASGEPAYETDTKKMKIGDGVQNYAALPYITGGSSSVDIYYTGYYLDNEFYEDSTYQTALPHDNQRIYVDLNSYMFYKYYGDSIKFKPVISEATDLKPGLVKLYKTHGTNEDGTMTQKVITEGVNSIKFAVEQTADEDGDDVPENILVLDLPWD